MKTRVYITDDRFGDYTIEKDILAELNADLIICDLKDMEDAKAQLKDADALLLNLFPMSAELISTLKQCKVISRYGVGVDNVDISAATAAGVWVSNVPNYCTDEVAVHTVGLLLAAIRSLTVRDRAVRSGAWNIATGNRSYRMEGKRLGIIGYGSVGREVHRRLACFRLTEVLICDPTKDPDFLRSQGGEPVPLETLLKESDYISIHVPLTKTTAGMINRETLNLMKPSAVLVNTSRGGVVVQKDLTTALQNGSIGAAALDVLEQEPPDGDDPLLQLDNVVLSDHCAYYSEDSIAELKAKAAYNVLEVLKGRSPVYPVNAL